jgi:hypothetical protein
MQYLRVANAEGATVDLCHSLARSRRGLVSRFARHQLLVFENHRRIRWPSPKGRFECLVVCWNVSLMRATRRYEEALRRTSTQN